MWRKKKNGYLLCGFASRETLDSTGAEKQETNRGKNTELWRQKNIFINAIWLLPSAE